MCLRTYWAFFFFFSLTDKQVISSTTYVGLVGFWKLVSVGPLWGSQGIPIWTHASVPRDWQLEPPEAWFQFLEMSLCSTVFMVSNINRPGGRMPKTSSGFFLGWSLSCITLTQSGQLFRRPWLHPKPTQDLLQITVCGVDLTGTEVCLLVKAVCLAIDWAVHTMIQKY